MTTEAEGRLLHGLDAQQQAAVMSPGAPLCIVAGAGSGKTTVLTRRIARRVADGTADSRHVLALTFTRQASGELTRRLAEFGLRDRPTVGTFHGVAYSVLRQRWEDQGRRPPTLLTNRASIVRGLGTLGASPAAVAEITSEIDWARARRITPDRYMPTAAKAGRQTNQAPERVMAAFAAYEAEKGKRGLIDFDDLLEQCLRTIEKDRAFADVQRWRFRHLFVDEFQDINPLQMKLLEMWRGGRPDLCIVGDPNQAIYGWNGADPSFLRNASKLYTGLTVVRLTANYRSTPEIIAAGQHVLGADASAVTVTRPQGKLPSLHQFASDAAEADGIAALLHNDRRPGQRWSSCAVLTRTNGQLVEIEQRLLAAGVPVRTRLPGAQISHPAVRSALADALEFTGRTAVRDWLAELQTKLQDPDHSLAIDARAALEQLVRATYDHLDSEPYPAASTLRSSLSGVQPQVDGVELLTFHAAKGREWNTVIVAGLERGLVPHSSAATAAALSEETRLLYVAITRATQTLHGTWATTRAGYRAGRKRSPLVDGLLTAEPPPVPVPSSLARPSRPKPDALTVSLQRWRALRARAAALPAQAIMDDSVMLAIARRRPDSLDALMSIPGMSSLAAARLGPELIALCLEASESAVRA